MRLIWHGHSCFTLESGQGTLVFDPYQEGSVPGLPALALRADLVLCSHDHRDHNAREAVRLTGNTPTLEVERLETFHDPEQGALRGPNTIHIVTADGLRLAHLGDLGCMPEEEQLARLKGLDVLLLPVGGYYTIDAAQAARLAELLRPRVVVPMHYRGEGFGYDVITPVDDFLALRRDVVPYPGNTLELGADTPAQTALLTLAR